MTVALLDACVLYPPALRNLLLWLAAGGVYRPRWSDAIHDEWIRNVLADRPDITPAQLARTRDLMNKTDALALVTGYEALISTLHLPDADDRHVLAAAIHANAAFLVTFNLRDFPASALAPFCIQALHPDAFLCTLFDATPETFLAAVAKHRASLIRPPETADEYLTTLQRNGLRRLPPALNCTGTFCKQHQPSRDLRDVAECPSAFAWQEGFLLCGSRKNAGRRQGPVLLCPRQAEHADTLRCGGKVGVKAQAGARKCGKAGCFW